MTESEALAKRLQTVINQKLEIACRICGITPEDTISGKKHINKAEGPGWMSYIYAEKKLCLVLVKSMMKKLWSDA
jgi:hypothetical protein